MVEKKEMRELNKNDSKMLQGLSVLAMLWLHLFCTMDYEGKYTPLLYAGGVPICFYIAQLSDYCVFGFAFLSGYAHMKLYSQSDYYKRRLKGLLSLLRSYWLILIVFSAAGILTGKGVFIPGNLKTFFLNVILVKSYCGAWWYLLTYAVIVVISPILLKTVQKHNGLLVLLAGFAIYFMAYIVRFRCDSENWFLVNLGPFGMTLFEYLIGAVAFKYQIISRIYQQWIKIPKVMRLIGSIISLLGMLWFRTIILPSLFVAPITGSVVMTLFHFWHKPDSVNKFFLLVGEHSTNIWLTHMFFYLYLFNGLAYKAKYPALIFAFMLTLTIAVSKGLKTVEKPIQRMISKL